MLDGAASWLHDKNGFIWYWINLVYFPVPFHTAEACTQSFHTWSKEEWFLSHRKLITYSHTGTIFLLASQLHPLLAEEEFAKTCPQLELLAQLELPQILFHLYIIILPSMVLYSQTSKIMLLKTAKLLSAFIGMDPTVQKQLMQGKSELDKQHLHSRNTSYATLNWISLQVLSFCF